MCPINNIIDFLLYQTLMTSFCDHNTCTLHVEHTCIVTSCNIILLILDYSDTMKTTVLLSLIVLTFNAFDNTTGKYVYAHTYVRISKRKLAI